MRARTKHEPLAETSTPHPCRTTSKGYAEPVEDDIFRDPREDAWTLELSADTGYFPFCSKWYSNTFIMMRTPAN